MKNLILLFLFLTGISRAQTLVSYNLIETYTTLQIDSILASNAIPGIILPSTHDINIYKVVYNTLNADSLPVIASGALFAPVNPQCKVPLMSYQHGTISLKTAVPSTLQTVEVLIGETSASDGAVVAMPDYLGLGDSPGLHPYVHAETEARATADLLVAAIEICDDLGIERTGQLFLLGYSQGGHATMATHQMIQESYTNYFTVTASTPMSGPYDISGVQAETISSNNSYPNPAYLPYFMLAYNDVYHIYNSISDFFVAPYDSILPPLFDGTHDLGEINAVMPSIPNEIIQPAVLDSFNSDPNYKLHHFLQLNDTYNWDPVTPMRMYYCEADMDVNYLNAIVAYDHFISNGNTLVSLQSGGATLDHAGCVLPSLLNAKFLFDSLRIDKIKLGFDITDASSATATDGVIIVHASSGFPPYSYSWSNGTNDSVNANLPVGFYTITVTDVTGCSVSASIFLSVQVGIDEIFAQQTVVTPNPMHSMATVQFPIEGLYSIELSDVWGKKLVSDKFFSQKYMILRKNLPAGIYSLKIQRNDGVPFVKLIVME